MTTTHVVTLAGKASSVVPVLADMTQRERADAWIQEVVSRGVESADVESADLDAYELCELAEAAVYLASRGLAPPATISQASERLRGDLPAMFEPHRDGLPPKQISPSWESISDEPYHCASIMRAVGDLGIGGFSQLLVRIRDEHQQILLTCGGEPSEQSPWGFALCRSRFVRNEWRDLLLAMFRVSSLSGDRDRQRPWVNSCQEGPGHQEIAVYRLCDLMFMNYCLGGAGERTWNFDEACDALLSQQSTSGGWRHMSSFPKDHIETTAKAIHVLCLVKPHGWESAVERAVEYLWSQQDESLGNWGHRYDPMFLTVLVLDAIDLAEGKGPVTCHLPLTDEEKESTLPLPSRLEQEQGTIVAEEAGGVDRERPERKHRGRPRKYDERQDLKIFEAWSTGQYRDYLELGKALGITRHDADKTVRRHKKRVQRRGTK